MLYHTNLIGRRVQINDTPDVPREYWGREAMICSSWLCTHTGEPRYTLSVRIAQEPKRDLWVCAGDKFKADK